MTTVDRSSNYLPAQMLAEGFRVLHESDPHNPHAEMVYGRLVLIAPDGAEVFRCGLFDGRGGAMARRIDEIAGYNGDARTLLTAEEFAALSGRSYDAVLRLCRSGAIPGVVATGTGRRTTYAIPDTAEALAAARSVRRGRPPRRGNP